jgi:hypothetical protein
MRYFAKAHTLLYEGAHAQFSQESGIASIACDVVMDVASHLVCDVDVLRSASPPDVEPERRSQACGISEPPQALAPGTNERRRQAPTLPPSSLGVPCAMHGRSCAKSAKDARTASTRTAGSELRYFPALLGNLGALRVMRSVEVLAANLTPRTQRAATGELEFGDLMFVGPLGDLGALCVMSTPSHAKSRKERKERQGPRATTLRSLSLAAGRPALRAGG